MIIEKREKKYWRMRCHQCCTVLLLDENDFTERELYPKYPGTRVKRVSTPCLVCGKLWDNINQDSLEVIFKEI